jgi:hypothetical protein
MEMAVVRAMAVMAWRRRGADRYQRDRSACGDGRDTREMSRSHREPPQDQ